MASGIGGRPITEFYLPKCWCIAVGVCSYTDSLTNSVVEPIFKPTEGIVKRCGSVVVATIMAVLAHSCHSLRRTDETTGRCDHSPVTKDIRKVKIQSPVNICKAFFLDSLVALLQHTFIYFST
jgi:hypothetical protein